MDKLKIRKEIILKRNSLSKEEKAQLDNKIFHNLIDSEFYKGANRIFIYVSYKSEVDTLDIINHSLIKGKNIYVPKTLKNKKEMIAVKIDSMQSLVPDNMGILEPDTFDKEDIGTEFDLIIMPGVAFDKVGNRIGYGGGYYDKYLSEYKINTPKIAVAYELQMVDFIKNEDHDIKVGYIITENSIMFL